MERLAFNTELAAHTRAEPRRADPPVPAAAPSAAPAAPERDRGAFNWLLAFTVVLFMRPQDHLPALQALHLADITATFALIALMSGRLGRGATVSRVTRELVGVLAFGALMLATAPFSIWPGGAIAVFTDLFGKVILVFALMINTITTRQRFEQFIGVVVVGTSYIAVLSVIGYFRGIGLVEGERASGAVKGLFENPNDMALNMVAFLPLAAVLALARARPLLRLVAVIGLPFIVASIIFSKSRGGLVGLVAMLLVLLYQMRRVRPGFAALVVVASLATVPLLPSSFIDRMSSIFNPAEDPTGSREARKRLMREGWKAFVEHPLFGLGAGQFQNHNPGGRREEAWRETHNAGLQVAAELGIGGVVVFTFVVGCGFAAVLGTGAVLRRSRPKRAKEREPYRRAREPMEMYAAAMAASLTGWFMAAMFASVAYYWTFYIVLGLATSLREIVRREMPAEPRAARGALAKQAA